MRHALGLVLPSPTQYVFPGTPVPDSYGVQGLVDASEMLARADHRPRSPDENGASSGRFPPSTDRVDASMGATCSTESTAGRHESTTPTVGVEEEFILVDPTSWLPSTDNAAVAETASTLGLDLQLELSRCQVETNSPVCHGIDELRTHLTDMRRLAAKAAELNGCRLLAVGAPLSGPSRFEISDSPRYRRMGERFGALAAEQSICGCHIPCGRR